MTEIDQLRAAAEATQKLHKKLRQLLNKGEASAADVQDAAAAAQSVRAIYARHKLKAFDLDSRAERKNRHEEY
jgi:hypothetical protein